MQFAESEVTRVRMLPTCLDECLWEELGETTATWEPGEYGELDEDEDEDDDSNDETF